MWDGSFSGLLSIANISTCDKTGMGKCLSIDVASENFCLLRHGVLATEELSDLMQSQSGTIFGDTVGS